MKGLHNTCENCQHCFKHTDDTEHGFIKLTSRGTQVNTRTELRTKTTHIEPILIELDEDKVLSDFLNAQSPKTRNTYNTLLRHVKEFSGQSGSEMLRNRKQWEHKILEYKNWLEQKGYASYTISSACGCLRGFFQHYRKPLILTPQEKRKIGRRIRTTEDKLLNQEELYKMFLCGSVKGRYVIGVGKCVGLRAEDFVKITYGLLRRLDLNAEAPLFLGKLPTSKEAIYAYSFLDNDAISAIKDLLEQNKGRDNKERVWKADEQNLSKILRRLARKAEIDFEGKTLRFHCLRKFCFDSLCRAMSEPKAKAIVGKANVESAYLNPENLCEEYIKAMPYLKLGNGQAVRAKVTELEEENKKLKEEIAKLKENEDILRIVAKKQLEETSHHKDIAMGIDEMTSKEEIEEFKRLRKFISGK